MKTQAALCIVAVIAATAAKAETFDAATQFNRTASQTLGSLWTHGYEAMFDSGFTLLNGYTGATPSNDFFYYDSSGGGPGVNLNDTDQNFIYPQPGPAVNSYPHTISLGPGGNGVRPNYVVIRFTSPYAGFFDVAGLFRDEQRATVDLHVLAHTPNGSVSFSSDLGTAFSMSAVQLAAGATVDFIVGNGVNNDSSFDVIGFQGSLSTNSQTTPGPSTTILFSAGGLLVFVGFSQPVRATRRQRGALIGALKRQVWGYGSM